MRERRYATLTVTAVIVIILGLCFYLLTQNLVAITDDQVEHDSDHGVLLDPESKEDDLLPPIESVTSYNNNNNNNNNAAPLPPLQNDESNSPDLIDDERGSITVDDIETTGVIFGDVYYNGMPISDVLTLRVCPEEIFGSLNYSYGPYDFYDDVEFSSFGNEIQLQLLNLSEFKIDGVSLDKNREELIAEFGSPIEFFVYPEYPEYPYDASIYGDSAMVYHISSSEAYYVLEFWFDSLYEKTYICRVFLVAGINKTGNE